MQLLQLGESRLRLEGGAQRVQLLDQPVKLLQPLDCLKGCHPLPRVEEDQAVLTQLMAEGKCWQSWSTLLEASQDTRQGGRSLNSG